MTLETSAKKELKGSTSNGEGGGNSCTCGRIRPSDEDAANTIG